MKCYVGFLGKTREKSQQSEVSIHGPVGYGPSTLPLRHSAPYKLESSQFIRKFSIPMKVLSLSL